MQLSTTVIAFSIALMACGSAPQGKSADPRFWCNRAMVATPYEQALESVLPMDFDVPFDAAIDSVIVVRRVFGTGQEETHIVIKHLRNGSVDLTVTRPSPSLFSQLNTLLDERPDRDLSGICNSLAVRTVDYSGVDEPALRSVVDVFLKLRFSPMIDRDLYLDAPRYDIAVLAPMNRFLATVYHPSDGSRHSSELVAWCERIIAEVDTMDRQRR